MLALVLVGLATGCAHNLRIDNLTSEQRARFDTIKISTGPTDRPHQVLGAVTGLSCHRNLYQTKDVSNDEALEGVRIRAAAMDADAVINTVCQKNSDTDWGNNCWASIKCIGDAVRFTQEK